MGKELLCYGAHRTLDSQSPDSSSFAPLQSNYSFSGQASSNCSFVLKSPLLACSACSKNTLDEPSRASQKPADSPLLLQLLPFPRTGEVRKQRVRGLLQSRQRDRKVPQRRQLLKNVPSRPRPSTGKTGAGKMFSRSGHTGRKRWTILL